MSDLGLYGGAAFWLAVVALDNGYGLGALLETARGGAGKEIGGDWDMQNLARAYFLRGYAFGRVRSLAGLALSAGCFVGALGTVLTWNPRSPFVKLEFACVVALILLMAMGHREKRRDLLKELAEDFQGPGMVRRRIETMTLERPARWVDVASLSPGFLSAGFLLAAILGEALLSFPTFAQGMQTGKDVAIWVLEFGSLFSLPIFLGFSLIGLFSWPVGGVAQSRYYPLLVLRRDLDQLFDRHRNK